MTEITREEIEKWRCAHAEMRAAGHADDEAPADFKRLVDAAEAHLIASAPGSIRRRRAISDLSREESGVAPVPLILADILRCARGWDPEARIIGNIRAGDIAVAIEHALSEPTRLASAHQDGRREGYREGVEAAARWHEERAEACEAIGGRWNGQLSRDAFVAAEEHRRQAATIRGLSPAPAEPDTAHLGHTDLMVSPEAIEEVLADADGWIEWHGHPHLPGTLVEIETEMGDRHGPGPVEDWLWGDSNNRIARYRIVKPAEPSAPVAGDGAHHGWFHVDGEDRVTWSLERPADEDAPAPDLIWPATLAAMHGEFMAACEALAEKRAEVDRQDDEIAALEAENAKLRDGIKAIVDHEDVRVHGNTVTKAASIALVAGPTDANERAEILRELCDLGMAIGRARAFLQGQEPTP